MRTKIMILSYALLMACSAEEVPEGLLTQKQIVPVLIDVYIAEGKVNNLRVTRDSSMAIFDEYEKRILERHQVDEELYRQSMSYYFSHPDQLEPIYEEVLDSLNLYEQRLKEMNEKKENE